MMYLLINNNQYIILQNINNSHTDRKIHAVKSNNNNWIVGDYLLTDCENIENTWYDWKEWLLSLQPTDDIPAPKPSRPAPKPKNP